MKNKKPQNLINKITWNVKTRVSKSEQLFPNPFLKCTFHFQKFVEAKTN